jgi:hypothetical protein
VALQAHQAAIEIQVGRRVACQDCRLGLATELEDKHHKLVLVLLAAADSLEVVLWIHHPLETLCLLKVCLWRRRSHIGA